MKLSGRLSCCVPSVSQEHFPCLCDCICHDGKGRISARNALKTNWGKSANVAVVATENWTVTMIPQRRFLESKLRFEAMHITNPR